MYFLPFLVAFQQLIKLSRCYFIKLPWLKCEYAIGISFGILYPLSKGVQPFPWLAESSFFTKRPDAIIAL